MGDRRHPVSPATTFRSIWIDNEGRRFFCLIRSFARKFIGQSLMTFTIGSLLSGASQAGETTVLFPGVGEPPQTGWRVAWHFEPVHGFEDERVTWVITDASFLRGFDEEENEDWIPVLDELRLAGLISLYHDSREFDDLTLAEHPFQFTQLSPDAVGGTLGNGRKLHQDVLPQRLGGAGTAVKLVEAHYVAEEIDDDHVRLIVPTVGAGSEQIVRGSVVWLWSVLEADNYRYIIKFGFVDDGSIRIRLGATGPVLHDRGGEHGANGDVHVHVGTWRMRFNLGAAAAVRVDEVRRVVGRDGEGSILTEPFNGGVEGGRRWVPEEFMRLLMTNPSTLNRHNPPRPVAYELVPSVQGTARSASAKMGDRLREDFWVTCHRADGAARGPAAELRFHDLPAATGDREPLHCAPVIWHKSSMLHVPRGEDFGPMGYDRRKGVALTAWMGFDLIPRDLFEKTPFANVPADGLDDDLWP